MVLPSDLREQLIRNLVYVCTDEGLNKSVWTIDLCYLLSRLGITYTFYTITLGIHPGYRNNNFYKKVLSRDENRVNQRFEAAQNNGIKMKKASLGITCLLEHLIYGPVIVLTNAKLLNCEQCKLKKVAFDLKSNCFPRSLPYQGHFVVLCGYNLERKKIFYRNPSLSDRKWIFKINCCVRDFCVFLGICVTSLECFDKARKCYGTDEDLIFIYL